MTPDHHQLYLRVQGFVDGTCKGWYSEDQTNWTEAFDLDMGKDISYIGPST